MSQSQTVEARLRIVTDSNGATQAINTYTGAITAAAKAEGKLGEASRKRADDQKRAATYGLKNDRDDYTTYRLAAAGSSHAAPGGQVPAWLQARQQEAESHRQRVLGSLGRQRQAEMERAAAESRRQEQSKQEFARQWRAAEDRRRVFGDGQLPGSAPVGHFVGDSADGRQAAYERRERMRRVLHGRGLNEDGSPRSAADRAGELMGEQRGLVGLAVGVATALPQMSAQASRQQTNPYTSTRGRYEELSRGVPVYGAVFGTGVDIGRGLTGENRRIGQQTKEHALAMFRQERMAALNDRLAGLSRTEGEAQRLREAFGVGGQIPNPHGIPYAPAAGEYSGRGFAGPRLPAGIDRATASGKREFEEASRLLPVRRELALLERQRSAAAMSVGDSMEREKKLANDIRVVSEKRDEAKRAADAAGLGGGRTGATGGAKAGEQDALNKLVEIDQKRAELQKRREDELETGLVAKQKLAGIESQERRAGVQLARAQLSIAEGREGQATAGAANLSRAGFGGRALGKAGLDLIKRVGVDYTPRELVDAARALDPEGVQKAEEAAGEKFKPGVRDRALDPTSPFLADAGEARKRADTARERAFKKEDEADVLDVSGAAKAFEGFGERLAEVVKKALKAQEDAFEAKLLEGNLGNR